MINLILSSSWGRGHPEEYTEAIAIGEEKFDDSDKKPRAGQILWIRGLTRLQTQVSNSFLIVNYGSVITFVICRVGGCT